MTKGEVWNRWMQSQMLFRRRFDADEPTELAAVICRYWANRYKRLDRIGK